MQLVYLESGHTRSTASQREAEIKSLSKEEKIKLIESKNNEAHGTVQSPI